MNHLKNFYLVMLLRAMRQESIPQASGMGKIDGVVALVMGLARAAIDGGIAESVYDERGLLFI